MKLFSKSSPPRTTLLAIVQSDPLHRSVSEAAQSLPMVDARVKRADDALADGSRLVNGSADVVLIEADLQDARALPLLRKLSDYVGVTGRLIVLARNADASGVRDMFRAGVDDVLELPLSAADIVRAVSDTLARLGETAAAGRTPNRSTRALGRVVSVLKSGGGVGGTMVAVNTAHNIASRRKIVSGDAPRTLVIDLDPQFGDVASVTGAEPRITVLDLVRKGDAFDTSSLETAVQTVAPDLDILASPREIVPLSALGTDFLARLLSAARARYDYIVLDHSTNWSAGTASLLKRSDLVVVVGTPCVEHATGGSTILSGLDELEVRRELVVVAHNRVRGLSQRQRVDSMDALFKRPSVSIPDDPKVHSVARNHARLLADTAGSKHQVRAVTRLVDLMFETLNTPVASSLEEARAARGDTTQSHSANDDNIRADDLHAQPPSASATRRPPANDFSTLDALSGG